MKRINKRLIQQEQLKIELEERMRKATDMKIDLNKITFDSDGKMEYKQKIKCDRLPKVEKTTDLKYKFSQSNTIRNNSYMIKKKLTELGARRVIMCSESDKQGLENKTRVKRKEI